MGCEGAMDIDLPTEVGSTEETVQALMEYLVGPLLPLKHSDNAKENPSESQQKSVAKQVHAAVLLYNYYHRDNHREREFLNFVQFCSLAIMFKPSILQHMKYMRQSDRPIIDDLENQLSLTEKAIMDACTIAETLLDASPDVSNSLKEWPITKVAVLLIDSKKENCLLQFNNGVWSVIEKDLHSENTGIGSGNKTGKKRKMALIEKLDVDEEAGFRKFAFSAVKEVAGVSEAHLKVLEGHVVYSLSRAKTATQFYIVQCTQLISEDLLVPIQDAICSLQGPVVKRSSGSWVITPVVEYYSLLPYAGIMLKWFSSGVSNNLQHQVGEGNTDANIFQVSKKSCEKEFGERKSVSSDKVNNNSKLELERHANNSSKERPCDIEVTEKRSRSHEHCTNLELVCKEADKDVTSELIGSPCDKEIIETENAIAKGRGDANSDGMKQNETDKSCIVKLNNSTSGTNNEDFDGPLVCLQRENQNKNAHSPLIVYHHQKRSAPTKGIIMKEEPTDLKSMSSISKGKDERVDGEKKSSIISPRRDRTPTVDHTLPSFPHNAESLEKLQSTMAAKGSELSQAALRALLTKREKLCYQLRNIEDELALCDKKIQEILDSGIEDGLDLKLETIIDCCNEMCQQDDIQAQDGTNQNVGRDLPPSLPLLGKKLAEAQLTLRKSCQELDDICRVNNWRLPKYHISHSDGGFVASVTVKGTDFECSDASGSQPTTREARNSAAALVIVKLQQMAVERTVTYLL